VAARFWRSILALAFAVALASGALVRRAFSLPLAGAGAVSIGVLLALPVAFVSFSFLLAQVVPDEPPARSSARRMFRALLSEMAEFTWTVFAMSGAVPTRSLPQHLPPDRPQRPILLLHGILCNARVWGPLRARLCSAGFGPVEALDLEPLLADIEILVRRVTPRLLALQRRCNDERVVIIAHSMGGLVARALLRDLGASAIRRIVTIATPHHGTALVRGLPWPNTRQMSRTSSWLRSLNAAQEGRFSVPVTSIYSSEDNMVMPVGSARFEGAELSELHGIGHLGMLRSRRALDSVIATLSQDDLDMSAPIR
jgi:pimeloyl-ACP methyl ester carboxylesterase